VDVVEVAVVAVASAAVGVVAVASVEVDVVAAVADSVLARENSFVLLDVQT
jgi:hypothetical protein